MKKLIVTTVWLLSLFYARALLALPAEVAIPTEIVSTLEQVAARQQLDSRILLAIAQEAQFNPDWVGVDNRYGVMQLSFELVQQQGAIKPAEVFDVQASASFAARYLTRLLTLYDGNLQRALYHYYQGKSADTVIRPGWFGSGKAWVSRVYKIIMHQAPEKTGRRFCYSPLYLDDFADPNSRLNRLRKSYVVCRPPEQCPAAAEQCGRYF